MKEIQQMRYDTYFPDDATKARAFDKIACRFYDGNFGSMQKTDIEVLLFSIYLERILDVSEDDMDSYSDYTISRILGIPQNRVSALKVKKELQYPYEKFDWKKSFCRLCKNAVYREGKIRINLRDRNLYYELKNQIEQAGGFVDVSLHTNVLIITPSQFFDLAVSIMSEEDCNELQERIRKRYIGDTELSDDIEKKPFSMILKEKGSEAAIEIIAELLKDLLPTPVSMGINLLKTAWDAIQQNK